MSAETGDWVPFDPQAESIPGTLHSSRVLGSEEGRVVAIVATGVARQEEWAARSATALARRWAEEGARVVLVDLDLENPILHRIVGVENGEGISDGFLYGASMARIAHRAPDGPFYFAPAGTPVADPDQVLHHERWEAVAAGFAAEKAALVVYLPSERSAGSKALQHASSVILLAGPQESPQEILGAASARLGGVLGPEWAEDVVGDEAPATAVGSGEEAVPAVTPRRSRGRWIAIILLIILMVVLLVGGVTGYIPIPGLTQ
jgi:hypothetical protein